VFRRFISALLYDNELCPNDTSFHLFLVVSLSAIENNLKIAFLKPVKFLAYSFCIRDIAVYKTSICNIKLIISF